MCTLSQTREGIIVPFRWRFGNLNLTYHGSLQRRRRCVLWHRSTRESQSRQECRSRQGHPCVLWHPRSRQLKGPVALAVAGVDDLAEVDETAAVEEVKSTSALLLYMSTLASLFQPPLPLGCQSRRGSRSRRVRTRLLWRSLFY